MRAAPLAFAIAALATGGNALAERSDREKEIVVTADKTSLDDKNRTAAFEGNVVVTQGTMRITAARVTLKEDAGKHQYYVAHGSPVTFRQKRDKVEEYVEGSAERAEFDDLNDVLKLYNRARVNSNQNVLTGDFISYDMRREVAEVSGAPPGSAAPKDSRVKVIILPPKKAPEGAKPAEGVTLKPDAGKP